MKIALECKSKHVTNENVWLSKVELVLERGTTKDSSLSCKKKELLETPKNGPILFTSNLPALKKSVYFLSTTNYKFMICWTLT